MRKTSIIIVFVMILSFCAYASYDYDDGWDDDGYYDDWEWGEDLLPEEAFDNYFHGSGLPVDKYDEFLHEFLGSGIGAEEFVEAKINDNKIKENKYDNKSNKNISSSKKDDSYCVLKKDGNVYRFDASGMPIKGWYHFQNGRYDKWYYYDLETGAEVKNKLIEWNGKLYYILDGEMVVNKMVNINGVDIVVDKDGVCNIKSDK